MSPGTNASKKTATTKKSTTACRKPKAKNYSSLDDQLLCTAYVNISSNGANGTGQTAEMFWNDNDVHKVFLSLHPPEKVAAVAQERDAASLMNRFQRHIQVPKQCSKDK
ncbi:hypothetical protein IV203_007566 [Nitzschia inconspicua]|uniref:Uncharacterized protein n=1 Tax=Nitzschia inconspicua TaxID=303405 RepID=A0A9K3KF50_9STRA|nr:hypothetical protein IV203_007566 [Nitzschia inconspicua]